MISQVAACSSLCLQLANPLEGPISEYRIPGPEGQCEIWTHTITPNPFSHVVTQQSGFGSGGPILVRLVPLEQPSHKQQEQPLKYKTVTFQCVFCAYMVHNIKDCVCVCVLMSSAARSSPAAIPATPHHEGH